MSHTVNVPAITRPARTVGVNLKYPADLQRLLDVQVFAAGYQPPASKPLGELLVSTDPEKWDAALKRWAADDSLPGSYQIRQAIEHTLSQEISACITAHADDFLAQARPEALKAVDTLNEAAAAGVRDLRDYEGATRLRIAGHLMDAHSAIEKLNAYSALVDALAGPHARGGDWQSIAAVIASPEDLTALATRRVGDGYLDKTIADSTAHRKWTDNLKIRNETASQRLLNVAAGQYEGFALSPVETITEARQRATRSADARQVTIENGNPVSSSALGVQAYAN